MAKQSESLQKTEKAFMDVFNQLCYSRSSWQVWSDVMSAIACSLSNAVDKTPGRYEAREKEYEQCIERLGSVELPAKLMGIIVMALDTNPEQDFLGTMYMKLNLGNHWKGQFFTPYNVCQCMANITIGPGVETEIKDKGYLSINDPACGAGATLIAAANTFRRHGIDYQKDVLFVGQDIDRVVGQMCYVQLSLLGCPGYIAIADTIANPVCGPAVAPYEKESQEFWYTPFYFRNAWIGRRIKEVLRIDNMVNKKPKQSAGDDDMYLDVFDMFDCHNDTILSESSDSGSSDSTVVAIRTNDVQVQLSITDLSGASKRTSKKVAAGQMNIFGL